MTTQAPWLGGSEQPTVGLMETREQWLGCALAIIRQYLHEKADVIVPDTTKVSCGLAGGRIGAKRIGECWNTVASAEGFTEIFISPVLSDVTGRAGVLATLVHEAIHAAVGVEVGHRKPFRDAALAAGLRGKMTATEADDLLMDMIAVWSSDLGKYPHAAMSTKGRKKQSTRLVKVQCDNADCGYVLRTTKKWLDKCGTPICTCNGLQMRAIIETDEEEEGSSDE
jgi:hypothetical protein